MNRIGIILVFSISFLLALLALPATGLAQQPTVGAAVNAASFLNANLPNGKLAQGGMFVLFGTGMGPATLENSNPYPFPTQVAGTSVRVTVGGASVDCLIVYSSAGQVAAILPSSAPVGSGTLTVTYNGQTSAPFSVQVAASNFGTFSINQGGSGPGVILDANTNQPNTLVSAANPGQLMDIWGTGLGPVAGDEAAGPLPGNQGNLNVLVTVGSVQAEIVYQGRSGCCAGIDQIRFRVPSGQIGCYVPVSLSVQGVASNFTTMSIAESGSTCSDPFSFTAQDLQVLQGSGQFRSAVTGLTRVRSFNPAIGETRADTAHASFIRYNLQQIISNSGAYPSIGSCTVVQITNNPAVGFAGLNAGTISLSGAAGSHNLQLNSPGLHTLSFIPPFGGIQVPGIPGTVTDGTVLNPGNYTFTGTGGSDVGAFNVSMNFPALFEWTNRGSINNVNRSQPLTITWTGGLAGYQIIITGTSPLSIETVGGAYFICVANATAGTFTVPASILSAIPPSAPGFGGAPTGSLTVGHVRFGDRFNVSGVDLAITSYLDFIGGAVAYQ